MPGGPPPPCLPTAGSRRLPHAHPCRPGHAGGAPAGLWPPVQCHLEGRWWAPEAFPAQRGGRGYRPRCQWRHRVRPGRDRGQVGTIDPPWRRELAPHTPSGDSPPQPPCGRKCALLRWYHGGASPLRRKGPGPGTDRYVAARCSGVAHLSAPLHRWGQVSGSSPHPPRPMPPCPPSASMALSSSGTRARAARRQSHALLDGLCPGRAPPAPPAPMGSMSQGRAGCSFSEGGASLGGHRFSDRGLSPCHLPSPVPQA